MSKKSVHAVVSGAGLLNSIVTAVSHEVMMLGGTDEDWHRLSRSDGCDQIVEIAQVITRAYQIQVVGSMLELLDRCGCDQVPCGIDDGSLQADQPHHCTAVLLPQNPATWGVPLMGEDGFRPGTFSELLALGDLFPWLQFQFPIVAPGTKVLDKLGNECIFGLTVSGHQNKKRILFARFLRQNLYSHTKFLAIRK